MARYVSRQKSAMVSAVVMALKASTHLASERRRGVGGRCRRAPAGGDFFGVERRELALGFVGEGEVEGEGRVGTCGDGEVVCVSPGIVVAVVVEEDDLAADLGLEFTRGDELRVKEAAEGRSRRAVGRSR